VLESSTAPPPVVACMHAYQARCLPLITLVQVLARARFPPSCPDKHCINQASNDACDDCCDSSSITGTCLIAELHGAFVIEHIVGMSDRHV
jgi:hypothetical protein